VPWPRTPRYSWVFCNFPYSLRITPQGLSRDLQLFAKEYPAPLRPCFCGSAPFSSYVFPPQFLSPGPVTKILPHLWLPPLVPFSGLPTLFSPFAVSCSFSGRESLTGPAQRFLDLIPEARAHLFFHTPSSFPVLVL